MTVRIDIKPELLRWAMERSGVDSAVLYSRFSKLGAWLDCSAKPTLKQAEAFARATHTPFGFLLLPMPPEEPLPIPDFRTVANNRIARPSANLLDTIYRCQQRQYWYREYLLNHGEPARAFVGSLSLECSVNDCADLIRKAIGFDVEKRMNLSSWEQALSEFIDLAERAGVLVMRSGIVDNHTRRILDVEEFRGFALADSLAPLIFINGADAKSAQMFTLAHELAHIWLGETALSDADMARPGTQATEAWCNQVAAEILAPTHYLRRELRPGEHIDASLARLTRTFKVSTLVILRRLFDIGQIERNVFFALYSQELDRLKHLQQKRGTGGDFYRSQPGKLSPTFARALISSAVEGRTSFRDAMRMLGVRKTSTFRQLGRQLQVLN